MIRVQITRDGKTEAQELRLGALRLCFSYTTCIGASYCGNHLRRTNVWGPTTGRHINSLGIAGWPEATDENHLHTFIEDALVDMGIDAMKDQLKKGEPQCV